MNLWEVQSAVASLLGTHPALSGVPILEDDGTYDRTPGRENALKMEGVVLIVWQIESDGIEAESRDGVLAHSVYCPVVIEENVERNRHGGLNQSWETLLQHVLEALSGRHRAGFTFHLMDPLWRNFGKVNGVQRVVANILVTSYVKPLAVAGNVSPST